VREDVILQVPAHAGDVRDDVDPERTQLVGGADAREKEHVR
jgi:hypothetical protein